MSIPIPGKPVRGSKTGQPIMALFDLLGRRWAMGIIWKLQSRSMKFRELQQACESISPTILNRRLAELRQAELVIHTSHGYGLTSLGEDLISKLKPLGEWSRSWAEVMTASKKDQASQQDKDPRS